MHTVESIEHHISIWTPNLSHSSRSTMWTRHFLCKSRYAFSDCANSTIRFVDLRWMSITLCFTPIRGARPPDHPIHFLNLVLTSFLDVNNVCTRRSFSPCASSFVLISIGIHQYMWCVVIVKREKIKKKTRRRRIGISWYRLHAHQSIHVCNHSFCNSKMMETKQQNVRNMEMVAVFFVAWYCVMCVVFFSRAVELWCECHNNREWLQQNSDSRRSIFEKKWKEGEDRESSETTHSNAMANNNARGHSRH